MANKSRRESLARRGWDAFNEGDLQGMLEVLSDQVEVYSSPELVNAGTYRGHEGFLSWITAWMDAWETVTAEVTGEEIIGERHVVTLVHQQGVGRGGIEVSMNLAFLFDVNDQGKCTYLAMVPTREEAFRIAEERESGA